MLIIITNREYIHKDEPHYAVKVSPTISWIAPKILLILPVSSLQKSANCWPLLIPPGFAYALTSSTIQTQTVCPLPTIPWYWTHWIY